MKQISSLEYNTLIWFVIRAGYIGLSIKNLIIISHQDAWISGLLALILGFIPLIMFIYLRNKNENILDLNTKVFGKFGTLLNFILALGAFLLVIILFLDLTYFVNSQFLFKTKYFYITICFIVPIVYALYKGINAISKTSLMLFYFVGMAILLIIIGIYNNISLDNIKPILNTSATSLGYGSVFLIAYNVLPLVLLLVIPKNKIENYKVKNSIMFYILAMFSLINAAFVTIAIFGSKLALLYDYPEFHILKKVKIGDFADRLENILALEWIIALLILIVIGIYFVSRFIKKTFNLNEKTTKRVSAFACLIVLFISQLSLLLNESTIPILENNMIYILYFCFFIVPLITFIGSLKKFKS